MILIKNTQRTIALDTDALLKNAKKILNLLDYDDFDLGIWLTTNKTIQRYNALYRNKNKPTDILSFSYHSTLKAGERIKPKTDEDKNLGDLIISVEYVLGAAQKLGVTLDERLSVLLVHGMLHLLGYDHERDEDYKIMHRKELFLLKSL